ncbi:unnamed protein product [Medioppia subpectinata]|uniref:Uncharacterized protein n=1 Tax=Medioppia subpectinata TaxID=1979941 RepID=A0A7R9Q6N4_9ACAR|nr:unnamed protein product [Medioppia subpectinata]CAG2113428.1 unnamed protein product [Medioppia subpectinata]
MDINWSPKLIQDVIRTLRKSRDARSYSSSEFSIISDEFIDELSHKMAVISRQASDDVFEPVVTLLSDEMQDVLQEMWKNFGPKMSYTLDKWQQLIADSYEQLARLYRQIMKAYDHVIPDWAHNVYQRSIRSARRQCKRSETCYKALYALENYGVDALMDLFYATAIETAHTTHRVVMTTSGKLWRALPNAPQWLREYGWQYKQWIRDSFDSLIASNDDLRQFVAHVQRLLAELTKDNFQEIEWPKVGASLRQMADVALSSQTSSRVLVWDPARGRVSVELRTPLQSRRLRSVMTDVKNKVLKSENPLQKKWKQIKQFVKKRELCFNSRDFCDFGTTLVFREIIERLPEECLVCGENHRFGERRRETATKEAEVLFVIGCDLESRDGREMARNLNRISNALKREFEKRSILTTFRTISLNSEKKYSDFWPKNDLNLRLNGIPISRNINQSFDFLFVTSRQPRASRHVILVQCGDGCEERDVDFQSARNHVLNENIFLHVLTKNEFKIRAKKGRHVIGVDAARAFVSSGQSVAEERALRSAIGVSRDLCHVLALETNGTVFRTKSLNSKNSRALIARRVAANHVMDACLDCDCVEARDRVTARVDCRLCAERESTISGEKVAENGFDLNQEWNEDTDEENGGEEEVEEEEEE